MTLDTHDFLVINTEQWIMSPGGAGDSYDSVHEYIEMEQFRGEGIQE